MAPSRHFTGHHVSVELADAAHNVIETQAVQLVVP